MKLTGQSPQSQRYLVSTTPVYFGIDVACARGKRLPICVATGRHPLIPLMIPKHLAGLIPRGVGNKEITATAPFREAARGVVKAIHRIVIEMDGRSNGSPSTLPPRRPQLAPGHPRMNSDVWPVVLPHTFGVRLGSHT